MDDQANVLKFMSPWKNWVWWAAAGINRWGTWPWKESEKGQHLWDRKSMWDLDRGVYVPVYIWIRVFMCVYTECTYAHMRIYGWTIYVYLCVCMFYASGCVCVMSVCMHICHAHKPWNSTLGLSSYDSYPSTRVLGMRRWDRPRLEVLCTPKPSSRG